MTAQELKLPYMNTREENGVRFLGLPALMRNRSRAINRKEPIL